MKKLILTLSIAIIFIFNSKSSYSQLWLLTDGGVFFTKDLVAGGYALKAGWHFGDYDLNMVTLGGSYNFLAQNPVDIIITDTLDIIVDTIESFLYSSLITIDADYRRYFFQTDADDIFGFYGLIGTSVWLLNTRVSVGTFADTLFKIQEGTNLLASNLSVRMPVGFGIDWTIRGRFWWYFETKVEVPFTQVNNDYIGNNFGVSYHFNTGARFLLWDVDY